MRPFDQDALNLYLTPYTPSTGVPGLFTQNYNYTFDNRGKFPTQAATDPVTGQPSDYFFESVELRIHRDPARSDAERGDRQQPARRSDLGF